MMKKKYVLLIAMISTMLCGCSNLKDTNTTEYIELEPVSESSEIINNESAETVEQVAQEREEDASVTEFIPSQSTTVFEYDSVNNAITINGIVYTIATNEMDYSGGYMPYYMANSTMENIVQCINNGDLSDTSWREEYPEKLQEKASASDLLEKFVSSGGKILDYYIINGDFYYSANDAEVPVVIQYSINGETYYSIWMFYMQSYVEPEVGVLYQITDIFQLDNLDGYTQEN